VLQKSKMSLSHDQGGETQAFSQVKEIYEKFGALGMWKPFAAPSSGAFSALI
jgi:hypothetical protein